MFKLIIVSSKKDHEDKFTPCAAFLSKSNSLEYINNATQEDPTTLYETTVVNVEDIEEMKVYQLINFKFDNKSDLIFYDKESAKQGIELLQYPKDTKIKERIIKGSEFLDKFMEKNGIKYYKHYQVLFKENGDIDTSCPKSNTIEDYYTKDIGIVTGKAIIDNDDPAAVRVSIYFTADNPISKEDLFNMAKIGRIDYIHTKYDLEY